MEKINWIFKKEIADKKRLAHFTCLCTFVWGLIAHAYGFMQNSFSHDVLNAFVATKTEDIWEVYVWRFLLVCIKHIYQQH